MLLETLDLKTKDILIYSKNQFNFNDNFKIIYKNEKIKRPHPISYFDVCNYIKDPSPKNLIVYRLLTNVQNLDAYSTKYGYFIKIDDKIELIYFDPIFAIKDLRHLQFNFDPHTFRFRIQQVGLTSITKWEKEPNFAEVYSFDLKAIEAQNQNDKIFADAIFALDPNYIDEEYVDSDFVIKPKSNSTIETDLRRNELNNIKEEIQESVKQQIKPENFNKPNSPSQDEVHALREEIISLLKQALVISENQFKGNKFESNKTIEEKDTAPRVENLFDLFKTTLKSEQLDKRKRENIILRFDKL
ncbi:MAG: hypothetical protein WHS65_01585 [Melioribacteraceae bacterium]